LYRYARMDLWGKYPTLPRRLFVAAPAVAAACWYVLLFGLARRRGWAAAGPRGLGGFACAAVLLVLAGLVFAPPNYLQPKMGMQRVVVCLDRESGEVLWETPVFLADLEPKYTVNSYATPTPCTDGQHVIAHFGSGTACLDYSSGRVLWKVVDPQYS